MLRSVLNCIFLVLAQMGDVYSVVKTQTDLLELQFNGRNGTQNRAISKEQLDDDFDWNGKINIHDGTNNQKLQAVPIALIAQSSQFEDNGRAVDSMVVWQSETHLQHEAPNNTFRVYVGKIIQKKTQSDISKVKESAENDGSASLSNKIVSFEHSKKKKLYLLGRSNKRRLNKTAEDVPGKENPKQNLTWKMHPSVHQTQNHKNMIPSEANQTETLLALIGPTSQKDRSKKKKFIHHFSSTVTPSDNLWYNEYKLHQRKRRQASEAKNLCDESKIYPKKIRSSCLCGSDECVYSTNEDQKNNKVNVAFNKPAQSSSRWYCAPRNCFVGCVSARTSAPACAAVNGRTSHILNTNSKSLNCIHTAFNDRSPSWQVDLLRPFTFTNIKVSGRNQRDHTYPRQEEDHERNTAVYRMMGLKIFLDGQLCFAFEPYGTTRAKVVEKYRSLWEGKPGKQDDGKEINFDFRCSKPLTAQHVIFKKHYRSWQYESLDNLILQLCEVQIFVCKEGYFGKDKCTRCPDNCPYGCDNYYGCLGFPGRQHNLAVKQKADTNIQSLMKYVHYAVDGIDWTCFFTNNIRSSEKSWKVHLAGLSRIGYILLIMQIREVGTKALMSIYTEGRSGRNLCHRVDGGLKASYNITCEDPRYPIAKYVQVAERKKNSLHLCEVLVFGKELTELETSSTGCSEGCLLVTCPNGQSCESNACKVNIGGQCSPDAPCVSGSTCESGTCKILLNGDCTDHKSSCSSITKCIKVGNKYLCKGILNSQCKVKSDCAADTPQGESDIVCDFLKTCKLSTKATCTKETDCAAGAKCDSNLCQCTPGAQNKDDGCEPKTTGTCSANQVLNRAFECVVKAGGTCNSGECPDGLTCEDNQCKIKVGTSCVDNENHCDVTSKCDSVQRVCKLKPGKSCGTNVDTCDSNSKCDETKCAIRGGQSCKESTTNCESSTECDSGICRKKLLESCGIRIDKLCMDNAVCDTDKKCRLDLSQTCTTNDQCRKGSECESNKCGKSLGYKCTNNDQCTSNSVCDDVLKICRLKRQASCKSNPKMCTGGSRCDSGTCQCLGEISKDAGSKCEPKDGFVGGKCSAKTKCTKFAICLTQEDDSTDGVCQCQDGYQPDFDLSCKYATGRACNTTQGRCLAGSTCSDDNVCQLDFNQPCPEDLQAHCLPGTICDSTELCKKNIGGSCNADSDCSSGKICDAFKLCKNPVGVEGVCSHNFSCSAGSQCDAKTGKCTCVASLSSASDKKCIPKPGKVGGKCVEGACDDPNARCKDACICNEDYAPENVNLVCKKSVSGGCTEDEECVTGTMCDADSKTCLIGPGYPCDTNTKCFSNAVCEENICKLNVGADCSGDNQENCRTTLFCDPVFKCKIGAGESCNASETEGLFLGCVAGALCSTENKCKCNTEVSVENGVVCSALSGRAGSICEEDNACSDTGTECNEELSICQCSVGYIFNDTYFRCDLDPTASKASSENATTFIIVGIVAGICLLALIVLGVVFRRRRSRRQDKYSNMMGKRMSLMDELKQETTNLESAAATTGTEQPSTTQASSTAPDASSVASTAMASDATTGAMSSVATDAPSAALESGAISNASLAGGEESNASIVPPES